MTVLFPPRLRLDGARVTVVVEPHQDLELWQSWCRSAVRAGAGMIMVPGTGAHVAEALSAARREIGNRLVGVVEPAGASVLTDVVHLASPAHAAHWPGTVTGCHVTTPAEAQAALAAGCAYLVADHRIPGLTGYLAGLEEPDLIWFVSGCETADALAAATEAGARRVWIEVADPPIAEWLRIVCQAGSAFAEPDPFARLNRRWSR